MAAWTARRPAVGQRIRAGCPSLREQERLAGPFWATASLVPGRWRYCVHCLFIDDVAVTVEAAQAARMPAHLLEDNIRTITRIAAHQRAVPALPDVSRT